MYLKKMRSKGFTMVELLVVAALMMFLMAMAAPFASSIRSDIAMRKVTKHTKSEILSTLAYALSSKSFAALSENDLTNPDLIPSHYALYFKTDEDYGDQSPYYYIELRAEVVDAQNQLAKNIYSIEKEIASPAVYLKEIRIKESDEDEGTPVSSAIVFFTPPFGKVDIVTGHDDIINGGSADINTISAFKESIDNKIIELDFQYKDEEQTLTTLRFGADKILNIL
jgi:type II secretory pathway pseudopilin PulG